MPNVIKIACTIALPLLMCACQSFSMQQTLPRATTCQPPPSPAAWIMQPYEPNLTQRMLNELSASPTAAAGD